MKCLVCREEKLMNRFQDLFFLSNQHLCQRCEGQLILNIKVVPKQNGVYVTLFEKNEFFLDVQKRIANGDLILMDIYYEQVKKQVLKYLKVCDGIVVVEQAKIPYPALVILKEKLESQLSALDQNQEKGVVVLSDYFDELIFSELNGFVAWIGLG